MIIIKKIDPYFFQMVLEKIKKLEIRLNDFIIRENDILILKEFNRITQSYTSRILRVKVFSVEILKIEEEERILLEKYTINLNLTTEPPENLDLTNHIYINPFEFYNCEEILEKGLKIIGIS